MIRRRESAGVERLNVKVMKHANFVLTTEKKNEISQNNSGNQEMIWATQFPSMGGPVGDREFGLIHSTVYSAWNLQ